jgi:hypothetical protein
MSQKRSELYSVLKFNEGGAGQVMKMAQLKAAGIECKRAYSPYIGQSGIEVFGNARVQRRAEKILFG